jgi:GDPmannose 4,6-dehydratase
VPTALITGITGQDGSYLAELLVAHGYAVHGIVPFNSHADATVSGVATLHRADLGDFASLLKAVIESQPDEVYNLAAVTDVVESFRSPDYTLAIAGCGVMRLLEAVRQAAPTARFFQAGSEAMFGNAPPPHDELTPIHPTSPYALGKAVAYWTTVLYREQYGVFASCGIFTNHESPRRPPQFVTRKVTLGAARIKTGLQDELLLGSLDASRDWGYAPDYVEGMRLALQHDIPDDFLFATGESHTIRELVEIAFGHLGLDWTRHVRTDDALGRPDDFVVHIGDATKARSVLGWRPTVSFEEMIVEMVESDYRALEGTAAERPSARP